ncbi:MAG TPA: sigma-70 family RNA polymerase sigma factor [Phycisphaerae bacterium]|nr:sigma-70 family RNA polymerase sigma factor [Phycisphaerae bacterium]HNU46145.1 sigma-70 family RNA polymerase sigma factor [Phycisphaerae bacterium]
MVIPVCEDLRSGSERGLEHLWYVADRRIRSVEAAERAAELAEWVSGRVKVAEEPSEQELFAGLHTCAYRASLRGRGQMVAADERAVWCRRWGELRTYLVEQNLGLAYSMMKRFGAKDLDRDELRSEALWALMRAVDRFDPWRECRFSTYACNAIRRALVTHWKKVGRYRRVFPAHHDGSYEELLERDEATDLYVERLQQVLEHNLGELTALEAKILNRRFPLDSSRRLTLQQIGDSIGLSNERVRQLQNRALGKLRAVLDADPALQ